MASKKQQSWEHQARLKRMGEKRDLKTFPGYWIRPQKYSIEGEEEIQCAQLRLKNKLSSSATRKIAARLRESGNPEITVEEFLKTLNDEELEELLQEGQKLEPGDSSNYVRLVLLHGIGEHNFKDAQGKTEEISEDFVKRFMRISETAHEAVKIIEEWNRPLARRSAPSSGTSPNGSTTGPPLPTTRKTGSSPTGQTPESS
jgi:hypothetical protein